MYFEKHMALSLSLSLMLMLLRPVSAGDFPWHSFAAVCWGASVLP